MPNGGTKGEGRKWLSPLPFWMPEYHQRPESQPASLQTLANGISRSIMPMENGLLMRLSAADAARLIMLEPISKTERHKFWHKREMRIKHSHHNKPRLDDLKRMDKASQDKYWEAFHEDWDEQFNQFFPNGPQAKPTNPLLFEHQNWNHALYNQADFDEDMEYYEEAREYLWLRFLRGQMDEGPRLDALVYIKLDSLLQAEQLRCKNKLAMSKQLITAKKSGKRRAAPKQEIWHNIGNDESVALAFKQNGHIIRKIDRLVGRHYEVLMT